MKLNRIALGLTAIVLMVLMVSTARACVGPGLSPGFWKHNLGVYLEEANGSYSDPGVTGIRTEPTVGPAFPVTKDNMATWFAALAGTPWYLNLESLYGDLCTRGGGAAGNAIRVGAANVFNYYADLFPY